MRVNSDVGCRIGFCSIKLDELMRQFLPVDEGGNPIWDRIAKLSDTVGNRVVFWEFYGHTTWADEALWDNARRYQALSRCYRQRIFSLGLIAVMFPLLVRRNGKREPQYIRGHTTEFNALRWNFFGAAETYRSQHVRAVRVMGVIRPVNWLNMQIVTTIQARYTQRSDLRPSSQPTVF